MIAIPGGSRRLTFLCLLVLATLLVSTAVRADRYPTRIIDAEVVATTGLRLPAPVPSLVVQGTSWLGSEHRYVLTIVNQTPWPITALHVRNRHFSRDETLPEHVREWFPPRLEPGEAAVASLLFAEGFYLDGCHQLELNIADGLGTILMDCTAPSATTVWNVPLSDEIVSYLSKPLLTLNQPEGPSKIGLHVTRNHDPALMAYVREAQPAVIVAVGYLGWLEDVKRESPQTITIGRFDEPDQTFTGDPRRRAREFVANHRDAYFANPGVDYWLGWNEPVISSVEDMAWYAEFEAERTVAMHALGLRVAIGNFATGTPEADQFRAFLPAVEEAQRHDGLLALHEYSAPSMRHGVGAGIPGLEATSDHGALTLRYRYWYDHYLRRYDLVVPLVITEAGIDGGVLREYPQQRFGWRDFGPDLGGELSAASYLEQLSWYDDELRRNPYVLGFAIFNVGDFDPKWHSFDVTELLPRLSEVAARKR